MGKSLIINLLIFTILSGCYVSVDTLVKSSTNELRSIAQGFPKHHNKGNWKSAIINNIAFSEVLSNKRDAKLIVQSKEEPSKKAYPDIILKTKVQYKCSDNFDSVHLEYDDNILDHDTIVTGQRTQSDNEIVISGLHYRDYTFFNKHNKLEVTLIDRCRNVYKFEFNITGETHLMSQRVRQAKKLLKNRENGSCKIGEYCF